MSELSILLVGSTSRSEFRNTRAALDEVARVLTAADSEAAAALLAGGQFAPDLIVVVQAYPGEFTPEAIDRFRRLAPVARTVALLGSWCEGEMRTGKPAPATVRVYWHEWLPRCSRELGRLQEGICSTWALPPTAAEEERLLAAAGEPVPKREGLIAISTPQFEMHDWLAAACRRRGYRTAWLRPRPYPATEVPAAAAAIFETTECLGDELAELEHLVATLRPAPVVVLADFPRAEDRDRVLAAGASALVSKPLLIEDLFWQIDRSVGALRTV